MSLMPTTSPISSPGIRSMLDIETPILPQAGDEHFHSAVQHNAVSQILYI